MKPVGERTTQRLHSRKRLDSSDDESDTCQERLMDSSTAGYDRMRGDREETNFSDKFLRGRWVRYFRYRYSEVCICVLIVLFPLTCIYAGYSIGRSFMPRNYPRFPDPDVVVDSTRLNYSLYRTHNITVDFVGGLGNQMFQYASMYGISKANGLLPIIKELSITARVFRSLRSRRSDDVRLGAKYAMYLERKSNAFDTRAFSLNFMRDIRLDGFFQSWRYFEHVQSDIRQQFTFRSSTIRQVDEFLREAQIKYAQKSTDDFDLADVKFVGVHIRRGDLLSDVNLEKGYTVADSTYIAKAIRYYENKFKNVIFVVTSDDMEWSRKNVEPRTGIAVFSEFNAAPFHDLCLLSRCNHSIITVGTFGWWAAWLADGETVYYRDFPKLGSPLRDDFRLGDYYLPRWIAM